MSAAVERPLALRVQVCVSLALIYIGAKLGVGMVDLLAPGESTVTEPTSKAVTRAIEVTSFTEVGTQPMWWAAALFDLTGRLLAYAGLEAHARTGSFTGGFARLGQLARGLVAEWLANRDSSLVTEHHTLLLPADDAYDLGR